MDPLSSSSSSRKRKGLGGKGKLVMMSFYRGTAANSNSNSNSTTPHCHHHTSTSTSTSTTTNRDRVTKGSGMTPSTTSTKHAREFILKQEQLVPQQSVSVLLPDSRGYAANVLDYSGFPVEDESVDAKATTYISTVRERIRQLHQVQTTINSGVIN